MAINKTQLLQMAQQLRNRQGTQGETETLERLAETGLSEEQQAQLRDVMRDKAKMQQLVGSPKAQALMKKLGMQPPGEQQSGE